MKLKKRNITEALSMSPFVALPEGLLLSIFSHLPFRDLMHTKLVCRLFESAIKYRLFKHLEIKYAIEYPIDYSEIHRGESVYKDYNNTLVDGGRITRCMENVLISTYAVSQNHEITIYHHTSQSKKGYTIKAHEHPLNPQCVDLAGYYTFVSGDTSGLLVVGPTSYSGAQKLAPQKAKTPTKERRFSLFRKKPAKPEAQALPPRAFPYQYQEHQAPIVRVIGLNDNHFLSFDASGVIKYWNVESLGSLRTLEANEPIVSGEYCDANSVYYVTLDHDQATQTMRFAVKHFDGSAPRTLFEHSGKALFSPENAVVRYHITHERLTFTVNENDTNHAYTVLHDKTTDETTLTTVQQPEPKNKSQFLFFTPKGEIYPMSCAQNMLHYEKPYKTDNLKPAIVSDRPVREFMFGQ